MKYRSLAVLATALLVCVVCVVVTGCAPNFGKPERHPPERPGVTLRFAVYQVPIGDFYAEKIKQFEKAHPHIKIELEVYKSSNDFYKVLKVRKIAGDMPDLFQLKPDFLEEFKSELLPLTGLAAAKSNLYADKYAIDGHIYGIPQVAFIELVYYHPSIFKELGLSIPDTWPQFVDTLAAIKRDGRYVPYAMGAKDAWTTYPFNEFMPHLMSGDEHYLSALAEQAAPFSPGTPFYEAFERIQALYDMKVMGPDPIGTTADQAQAMFESKQAAVMAAGMWELPKYLKNTRGLDDLDAFPMPLRDSETEPLTVMTFSDYFFAANRNGRHTEEAKAFIDWAFSPDIYQEYINRSMMISTAQGIESDHPFLKKIQAGYAYRPFLYRPGKERYVKLVKYMQYDPRYVGQEMLAGRRLEHISADLNARWAKAKQALEQPP